MHDVLNDPKLRRVFSLLESDLPPIMFEDLVSGRRSSRPVLWRLKVALVAVGILVIANPVTGVILARRAIADAPAVGDRPITLTIRSEEIDQPWAQDWVNLSGTSGGVLASSGHEDRTPGSWLLDETFTWTELPSFEGETNLLDTAWYSGQLVGTVIGFTESESTGSILSLDPIKASWETLFNSGEEVLSHLIPFDEHLLAVGSGYSSGSYPVGWAITDATARPADFGRPDRASISAVGTHNGVAIAVGGREGRLPFIESVKPVIWRTEDGISWESVDLPSLRSRGFGYWIGGFRMASGLEIAAAGKAGFLASSGGLQLWEGFQNGGISMETGEAWSTLVMTSPNGLEWTPHILGGLALWQVVPFDEGWLALGSLKPDSDTETIRLETGEELLVAATPPTALYYSTDGAIWQPVTESPQLEQPAMSPVGTDTVVIVDQADRQSRVVQAYLISK